MRPSLSVPWRDFKYALWLPVYLASFLLLEQHVDGSHGYWSTQLPLDRLIPFQELFVVPYCIWYPLLVTVGLYLLLRDGNAFRRYMCFLAVSFFLSELIWLLIPNGQDLRPLVMPRNNLFTRWVAGLYSIDTNTNVFPSVHVVGSIGAALAVWDGLRRKPVLCWGTAALSVLICLSTLFIKQHAVLDVAGGAVLSALVALPIYRRVPLTAFRLRRRSRPLENPE